MIAIHYTEGPDSLQDVSIELSNNILKMMDESYTDEELSNMFNISVQSIRDLRDIKSKKLRRCCFCGALFDGKGSPRRSVCHKAKHFLPCIDCGELIEVKESYVNYMKAGGRRCSSCRGKQIGETRRNKSPEEKAKIVSKTQSTMIERYGAATPLQVPEMKAKIQATIKDKYGVDNLSQSKEIQDRIRQNSLSKYGVEHYTNNPTIRKRMIDGMIAKYGVDNPQKDADIRNKTQQTNLNRYGVRNPFESKEVRDTYVRNHIAKYGVAWPHQRPDLIEKVKQSNIKKYGYAMYPISDEYMVNVISDPSKFNNYKQFMDDPEKFINNNYATKPTAKQICEDTGLSDTTVYDKLISIGRRDLATEACYTLENEVIEYLTQLRSDIKVVKHNRSILNGKEIDIYLPDFNIGFECNPTYTHNSSFSDPWGCPPKYYKYHAEKSLQALDKGVFIYHIFGYEWKYRQSTIKSQIQNLIGCNDFKIYARNTKVITISSSEASEFLFNNHRQGNAQASVRLALILPESNQIVSIMTFGKMRPGIGKKSDQLDTEWELVRFCNNCGTSVVGGASKLLKYFIRNYEWTKIVSFSDIAHTRGSLYSTLGFKQVSVSDPGYVWVELKTDKFYNRMSCQKSNLPNLFDDVDSDYIKTHTESEIMMSHGFARVYDCGTIRWELDCN